MPSFQKEEKMKYDFTSILNRNGKDSIAVDPPEGCLQAEKIKEGFDEIPMWVADMNFPVAPSITREIIKRAEHPSFGYFMPSKEYYAAIIRWQKTHNGMEVKEENIGYDNGVLGGVISVLNVLASKGDNILIHSPTYIGFTDALENNGYHIIHTKLFRGNDNVWKMNYEDMEKQIVENSIHACVLCNPHNPCGRVWSKEELEKAYAIFEKHDVWVIEDGIWSDLLLNGNQYTPAQSISEYARMHTASMYAPSKTFNLAGLVGSYHIIYNKWLKDRVEKESSLSHYNAMNVLWMHALIGAYQEEGEQWLYELRKVLSDNINFAVDYISKNFNGIRVSKPQGTYMLLLDCEQWCKRHQMSMDDLLKKGVAYGVLWQDGRPFYEPYGIRMNLALPACRVKEAFQRLNQYVFYVEQ